MAVFLLSSVFTTSFASEWTHLLDPQSRLDSGRKDRVSTLTAGAIPRISHFLSWKCSRGFRYAFKAWGSGLVLAVMAPSSIDLQLINQPDPMTDIFVGNLTIKAMEMFDNPPTDFTAPIIQLEQQFLNVTYIAKTEPGVFIPWPSLNILEDVHDVNYTSDVVYYNHTCTFAAPSIIPGPGDVVCGLIWKTDEKGPVWTSLECDSATGSSGGKPKVPEILRLPISYF